MNLRCMYCQTMFGISRENMLIALQAMEAESLNHYDFHCPKCRRANRVERKKLELANPNWQETLKVMAKEAAKVEKEQAVAAPTEEKKAPAKAKAAPKTAAKKPASKPAAKPAPKPKTTAAKKPVATKIPATKTSSTSSPKGKTKGK